MKILLQMLPEEAEAVRVYLKLVVNLTDRESHLGRGLAHIYEKTSSALALAGKPSGSKLERRPR